MGLDDVTRLIEPTSGRGPEPAQPKPAKSGPPDRTDDGGKVDSIPQAHQVLAQWQQVTGHSLRVERQREFLARPVVGELAAVPSAVRLAAAQQLWATGGRLLLEDWLLDCRCPGTSSLVPTWQDGGELGVDTVLILRELITAAIDEVPGWRDRGILVRRLGLQDQPAQTLEQVATVFDVSRGRISQAQNRALGRMSRAAAPATRRLRALLADLAGLAAAEGEPTTPERLLGMGEALLPSLAPRYAAALVARLAGVPRARAENLAAEAMTVRVARLAEARREVARQGRTERAALRWSRIAGDVQWPEHPGEAPRREDLQALRDMNDDRAGAWFCRKLEREVLYESDSELHVIQLLSFAPQVAFYQEQPLAIGYEFDGRRRTYFPDLLAVTTDGRCILIEVKPLYEAATAINVAKYDALAALCRNRGWGWLVTDGNRSRTLLETRPVSPQLAELLGSALAQQGELTWPQICAATPGLTFDWADLAALVLRNGWDWRHRPYRLRAPRTGTVGGGWVGAAEAEVPSAMPSAEMPAVQDSLLGDDALEPVRPPVIPTLEEIEAARTPAGGWTRRQLAAWGVSWPPTKGWKQNLVNQSKRAQP
ncbi:TnsA endonuclease N-terminal domain-containing protein [Kitasatospora sp. NPDC058243]|uniref:TnsA endonuclease N-terminal domain-containing protein n=1 Tax=Kitasatospora sp. NPDC058243 TaxID=3346397 RepID=UPI0036D946E5